MSVKIVYANKRLGKRGATLVSTLVAAGLLGVIVLGAGNLLLKARQATEKTRALSDLAAFHNETISVIKTADIISYFHAQINSSLELQKCFNTGGTDCKENYGGDDDTTEFELFFQLREQVDDGNDLNTTESEAYFDAFLGQFGFNKSYTKSGETCTTYPNYPCFLKRTLEYKYICEIEDTNGDDIIDGSDLDRECQGLDIYVKTFMTDQDGEEQTKSTDFNYSRYILVGANRNLLSACGGTQPFGEVEFENNTTICVDSSKVKDCDNGTTTDEGYLFYRIDGDSENFYCSDIESTTTDCSSGSDIGYSEFLPNADAVCAGAVVANLSYHNCKEIKDAGADTIGDGVYEIDPGLSSGPFDVYCDMTTNGGGWTLVGRGRDNWRWRNSGRNTGSVQLNVGTTSAFTPSYLPSSTIDKIVKNEAIRDLTDNVRLKKASSSNGSTYHEYRWDIDTSSWNWNFDSSLGLTQTIAGTTNNYSTYRSTNSYNNTYNIFTWAWSGHNNRDGFASGRHVFNGSTSSSNYGYSATGGGDYPIAYTEVYVRE